MKKPFTAENMYLGWDEPIYETVCMLIIDEGISDKDIMDDVMPALCNVGLILPGDDYKVARAGNTILIGKSRGYIDMEIDGTVN